MSGLFKNAFMRGDAGVVSALAYDFKTMVVLNIGYLLSQPITINLGKLFNIKRTIGRLLWMSIFIACVMAVMIPYIMISHSLYNAKINNQINQFHEYVKNGDIAKAQHIAYLTHQSAMAKLGADNLNTAAATHNIGYINFILNNYDYALPFFEQAFDTRMKKLNNNNIDTIESQSYLAKTYEELGNFELALKNYMAILETTKIMPEAKNQNIINELNNYYALTTGDNIYDNPLAMVFRQYQMNERQFGKNHIQTANSMHDLATIYQSQEDYSQAITLYERALRARVVILGENNIDTLNTIMGLADIYQITKKYELALPYYERALKISENLYHNDSHDYAIALMNMGEIKTKLKQNNDAIAYFQTALKISKENFGEFHPEVLLIQDNIDQLSKL